MSDPTPTPRAQRRVLIGGCAVVLVLLAGIVSSAVWLWSELRAPSATSEVDDAGVPAGSGDREDAEGRPRRSERRAREIEMGRLERELEFARDQARVASDEGTRDSWRARVAELSEQLRVLRGD